MGQSTQSMRPVLTSYSGLTLAAVLPPTVPQQPLPAPAHGHFPDLFTNIHHPHHRMGRVILLRVLHDPRNMGPTRTRHLRSHIQLDSSQVQWLCNIEARPNQHNNRRGPDIPLPSPHTIRHSCSTILLLSATISILQHRQRCLHLHLLPRQRPSAHPRLQPLQPRRAPHPANPDPLRHHQR